MVNKRELAKVLEVALGRQFRVVDVGDSHDGTAVTLEGFGRRYRLFAHWAGAGWPSFVRAVAERLGSPWPPRAVIVAHRLSVGALAWLEDRDANYADGTGRARIATPDGLVVLREALAGRARRKETFGWSPGRADVAEMLLAERRVPPVREIAARTGLDIALVSRALRLFDTQGWTAKQGPERGRRAARRVVSGDELLDSWAESTTDAKSEKLLAHSVMRDPLAYLERELGPALTRVGRWAASGWAGVQLVAPYLTTVPTLHVYVEAGLFGEPLRSAMSAVQAREVAEGERITVWPARPVALHMARPVGAGRVPVVHPARLYADLLALGDRGRAAAEHVQRELLGAR